jgi:hypothetical protein
MGDIPRDVSHVKVHISVKMIDHDAFRNCSRLRRVDLCEGLEKLGNGEFLECASLLGVVIPSSVKVIDHDIPLLLAVEACGSRQGARGDWEWGILLVHIIT